MGETIKDPLLQKIWMIRKRLRLNQADLAKALGVKQRTYSAIENGTNRMYADYLPIISKALGVSIGDLFGESDPEIGPLRKEEKAMVLEYRGISDKTKREFALLGIKALKDPEK